MRSRDRGLDERVAIVTGGGSGIGRATVRLLAERGASVFIAERRLQAGRHTERQVLRSGGSAWFLATDVADGPSVQRMVRRCLRRFGRVDILVNNAGILSVADVVQTPLAVWQRVLAVNLTGPFLCARAVLPSMLRQQAGCIINVASQMGKETLPELAAYCASKFGLLGFTGSLAQEVAEHGIRVYAVCPGPVDTPMWHSFMQEGDRSNLCEAPSGPFRQIGPVPFLHGPEEVARLIVDLAAGRRRVRSGAVLDVT